MSLLLVPVLPLIVALIQSGIFFNAKRQDRPRPPAALLVTKSIKFGIVGAAISLLLTITWMVWYEYTSGFSAGNGPIAWIFIYGPLSFAVGQVMAQIKWWPNAL